MQHEYSSDLAHIVLSWSIENILNQKQSPFEVETIPKEFETFAEYIKAFQNPTLEEIRHQIYSSMANFSSGPYVDDFRKTKNAYEYFMELKVPNVENVPKKGDLLLFSARNLKSIDQILNDGSFCAILLVMWISTEHNTQEGDVKVKMSALRSRSKYGGKLNMQSCYYQVTHLTNLTTFQASWEVLRRGFQRSSEIIDLILTKKNNGADGESGQHTDKASICSAAYADFGLNKAQQDVVASCISAIKGSDRPSVRLIWGPPGTGKTKTVSAMLHMLLRMQRKHRILVCAPTNTAIIQLASRLVSLIKTYPETIGLLDDIILFGNDKRLKTNNELSNIHLNVRASELPIRGKKAEDKCLRDAKLLFCTPCTSARLQNQECSILVIDEAANLKECDSIIPLAVTGIRHVVLIGDDKQLPAVVKSPIAQEAKYGRSLFERLSEIGYPKQLLNVQYRMHPSISKFPNEKFYNGKIIDGPNIKGYNNIYLHDGIFGLYSFINIEDGMEQRMDQSIKNMVEATVAANIVDRLAQACAEQKKKTSVGVISQYAAQVTALQEIIGIYQNHDFLSVQVSTVDSFQGAEKDIIILSTARCNHFGNVGFIDCGRRANVAMTRAKYCLWVLGHGTTLLDSNSIWHDVVQDVKRRQCYFDARDDTCLARKIDEFTAMHKYSDMGQDQLGSSVPDGQFAGDSHVTRPEGAQVEEPAQSEQVPVQAEGAVEKTEQMHLDHFSLSNSPREPAPALGLSSQKRVRTLDEGQPAKRARPEIPQVGAPVPEQAVEETYVHPVATENVEMTSNVVEIVSMFSHYLILSSRKRARSLDEVQPARSEIPQVGELAPAQAVEEAYIRPVTNEALEELVDSSARSLDEGQPARPEIPQAGEPAPAQAVEEAYIRPVTIEALEQLVDSSVVSRIPVDYRGKSAKAARFSLSKRQNFYEHARSARDGRFWSTEQEDLYTSIYNSSKSKFAGNKWVNWERINHSREFRYLEEKWRDIGLHKLISTKQNWHAETVKQFFSTFYINPSRSLLTWMTGINRKITVTKRFCQEVLLDSPRHKSKIEDSLNDTLKKELNIADPEHFYAEKIEDRLSDTQKKEIKSVDDEYFNAAVRMVRKTILPKAGDKGEIHNENQTIVYHVLFGKPFDFVDVMFREIQKTRTDTRMLLPYAPYIMLLINHATGGKIVPESGDGYEEHSEYKIMTMEAKQPQSNRASKSKKSLRVPPLVKKLHN